MGIRIRTLTLVLTRFGVFTIFQRRS